MDSRNPDYHAREQEARIALLKYFGSLARHWATIVLAAAVSFFSVVELWDTIENAWIIGFALWMIAIEGTYALLRTVAHGRYCELALDPTVIPRGEGRDTTRVGQVLHGMWFSFRSKWSWKQLDRLGKFMGWLCWTTAFASVFIFGASVAYLSTVGANPFWSSIVTVVMIIAVGAAVVACIRFCDVKLENLDGETEVPLSKLLSGGRTNESPSEPRNRMENNAARRQRHRTRTRPLG